MDLRVLRYFIATAEELSFVRAAERVAVSQPALGRQIAELERELGVALFERTTRRVRLTRAGEVLLSRARHILDEVERAVDETRRAGHGEIGSLTIGYLPTTMVSILPAIVAAFRTTAPGVSLAFDELLDDDQARRIASGRLDVGFVRGLPPGSPLAAEPLLTEPFVVALPAGHRLAGAASLELRDLANEPLLIWPRSQAASTYDLVIAACHAAGFTPRIVELSARSLGILGLVTANLGVALFAASYANLRRDGLVYVPLRSELSSTLQMIWNPASVSPSAARFIEVARAEAGRAAGRPRPAP